MFEQITHRDLEPEETLPAIDTTRPFAVWVQATGAGDYEVVARRPDASLLTIVRGIAQPDALRVAARIRSAVDDDEPWAERLIDVSAGKLRG